MKHLTFKLMEEMMLQIPLSKLMDLVLAEQKADIKKYLFSTLGQPTADFIDQYVPSTGGILDVIKSLK